MNKFSLIPLIFSFMTMTLYGQEDSLSQSNISKVLNSTEKENGIKLYYDLGEIMHVGIDTIKSINSLEKVLSDKGYSLVKYSEEQYIIVSTEKFNLSSKEWKDERELILFSRQANEEDIVIVGTFNEIIGNEEYTITGVLKNANNDLPVIGATINIGEKGTVSDLDGKYQISMPAGKYKLVISSIGFEPVNERIFIRGNGDYDIKMYNSSVKLEEVIISGEADNENVSSLEMGLEKLTLTEIKKLPSFMGELDVIKSLLSLPGVSTAGDGVGGINVRGGNVDQNLFIQDGIVFFNPSHSLGFFNLFHPDLVNDVKLYKGNIPPKYGGRISSVLYTSSKDGSRSNWSGKVGLGLTSSKVAVDGPLIEEKLSMTFGGRISTANWLLNSVNVPDVEKSSLNFYDLQGKLNYWIDDNSNVGVQYYNSNDDFTLSDELQFDYQTKVLSLFYNKVIGDNKSLNARVVSSQYNSNLNDLLPTNSTRFNTGVNYLSSRLDLTMEKSKSYFNIGVEGIHYTIKPGSVFPGADDSKVEEEVISDELGLELGIYLNAEWQVSKKLKVLGGMRLSGFAALGPKNVRHYSTDRFFDANYITGSEFVESGIVESFYGIEPRLAANFNLSESTSLKIGYNRTYQYLSQISNTVAATPVDFWKISDNNIKPQSANSISLGYYKNFKDNLWKTSFELYYRTIENSLAYRDFADLVANDQIETELLLGEGTHYGAEVSIEKTLGKLTSKLGYSYTRSLLKMEFDNPNYTINQGKWYPSNFDKPHNVNLLMNLNISKRINFNLNFSFSSGRSISAPIGKYDDFNVSGISIYDEVNNFRIPDFHRLDFSLNVFPGYRKDKKVKGSWNFSLYNVYGRKNAYSVYFEQQSVNDLKAKKLAILGTVFPSISYNITFK